MSALVQWIIPILGGFCLSVSFPNEILPGHWGDHPPVFLGWIALIVMLWPLCVLPERQAQNAAWVAAWCLYIGTLSWVRLFGFLPWLALASYFSLTGPITIWLTQRMQLPKWLMPLGIALSWTGIEWLRSQGIFGLAWSEIGASQVDGYISNIASLGSIHLITFLMLWVIGTSIQAVRRIEMPRWLLPVAYGSLAICILAGWWQTNICMQRWQTAQRKQVFSVIQPSVLRGLTPAALVHTLTPQQLAWRLGIIIHLSQQSITRYRPESSYYTGERPLVVWPESAVSYPPDSSIDIFNFCRRMRTHLLAGGVYFAPPKYNPRNSAYLIGPDGFDEGRYDKIHLVPFGEFVPMRSFISHFYTVRDNDLKPGDGWKPLLVGPHQIGIGICFESTFSSIARQYARQGAHYLVYITNDAWFHRTSAVRQHFNHARFRALETGLPVIRSASTGISGFIAPNGSIISEIPNYNRGSRTRSIPEGTPGTVYTLIGWLFAPCCLLAALILCLRGIFISRRESSMTPTLQH